MLRAATLLLVFSLYADYSAEEEAALRDFIAAGNPAIRILAVQPAPEAPPYPDAPPWQRYGWQVLYETPEEAR